MREPLAELLERLQVDTLERGRGAPWVPASHYASNLGHPCLFYLYAARVRYEEAVSPDASRLGLFNMGYEMERIVKNQLATAGLDVLEAQGRADDKELGIGGRIDCRIRGTAKTTEYLGRLAYEGEVLDVPELFTKQGVLCEIKGINQADFEALRSVDDMVASRKPWVIRWPAQLLFYMSVTGEDVGLFLFISKVTGMWNPIVVRPWPELLEDCLARIRRVNGYIKLGMEPPALEYTPHLCARCDWSHICPTAAEVRAKGEGLKVSSASFDEDLGLITDCEEAGKMYSQARDRVKEMLNQMNVWPEEGAVSTLVTDNYTLLLETKNDKHYWSIQTGKENGRGESGAAA